MSVKEITRRLILVLVLIPGGGLVFAAAVGLLPSMKGHNPVAGFLVGLPFSLIMVGVGLSLGREILRATGLARSLSGVQLAGRLLTLLLKRPKWRSLLAAAPFGVLAAQYLELGESRLLVVPGVTEAMLVEVLQIQCLYIHGSPFLALSARLATQPGWRRTASGLALVALLLFMYSAAARNVAGEPFGAWTFLYLAFPDLLYFMWKDTREAARPRLALRWTLQVVAMAWVLVATDAGFHQNAATFRAGFALFSLFALVEFFRLPEVPVDIASAMEAEARREERSPSTV
ncbi:MAG: hypothetical protein ACOYXN_11405 [Acidobacteriota bacterium]